MNEQNQIALLLKQLHGVAKLYKDEHGAGSASFIQSAISHICETEEMKKCDGCNSYASKDDLKCHLENDDYEVEGDYCPDCIDDVITEAKNDDRAMSATYKSLQNWGR